MAKYEASPWLTRTLFLLIGLLIGLKVHNLQKKKLTSSTEYNKISSILRCIDENYVDKVDIDSITDCGVNSILGYLDPHSVYIPKQRFKEAEEEIEGNFEGVGVQFRIIEDTVTVIMPVQGGPSEKIGIKSGDRIVRVDTLDIAGIGITNEDVTKYLKGPKGSKVNLGIKRHSETQILDFEVQRDVIPNKSVDVYFMATSSTGYIKLSKFSRSTDKEFFEAALKLRDKGMQKLIVDLRSNGGGLLASCISMADMFLEKGDNIVYTEGRNRRRINISATGKGLFKDCELIVMIDEWSASASEIFAGAMQDNDRAIILGRRSFGKGLVQEQIDISDGSAIRLTTSRYYTPSGRSIQKPYKMGQNQDYEADLLNRYVSGEMTGQDTNLHHSDTLKYYTKKKNRLVYGGGGIEPDVLVPYRSGEIYTYWNTLSRKGLFYSFSFNYADKNRETLLSRYSSAQDFVENFKLGEDIFESFLQYTEKEGVARDNKSIEYNKERMLSILEAYIGRDLFDDFAFYPIYLKTDEDYIKALELINPK